MGGDIIARLLLIRSKAVLPERRFDALLLLAADEQQTTAQNEAGELAHQAPAG
jgi:hypothetical protein